MVSQQSRSCVLCLSLPWGTLMSFRVSNTVLKRQRAAPKNLAQWELPDLSSWNLQVKSFLNFPLFRLQRQAPLWPPLVFFTCHISSSPAVMMFWADHSAVRLSVCNSPGNTFVVCVFNLCISDHFQKTSHPLHAIVLGYCAPEITYAFNLSQAGSVIIATLLVLFLT